MVLPPEITAVIPFLKNDGIEKWNDIDSEPHWELVSGHQVRNGSPFQ